MLSNEEQIDSNRFALPPATLPAVAAWLNEAMLAGSFTIREDASVEFEHLSDEVLFMLAWGAVRAKPT